MDRPFILNHILTFILTLYGDPSLPRKIVQTVVDHMDNLFRNAILASLLNDILSVLKEKNLEDATLRAIEEQFSNYSTVFDDVSTEPKRFNILKPNGLIDFEWYTIGITFVKKVVVNIEVAVPEKLPGIYVPLRKTMKLFLETPGLFNQISDYTNSLSNSSGFIISNIMQAGLWLRKYSKNVAGVIILPLYIFYDELEAGNALGSHAAENKFGVLYARIAFLPPEIASKLCSIIFTMLVHATDKTKTTNARVFQKLIDELNVLQKVRNRNSYRWDQEASQV